jgi:hypothetical protein
MAVIRQVLQDVNAATADTQPHAAAHTTSPSSSTDAASSSPIGCDDGAAELASSTDRSSRSGSGGGASASSNGRVLLRAVVEVASILPSNGRLATLNQGYSVGAWTALLASHGFDVTTVHVLSWKKDMGLLKRDKDSSRQLAKTLFRQAGAPQDDLLRWVTSSTVVMQSRNCSVTRRQQVCRPEQGVWCRHQLQLHDCVSTVKPLKNTVVLTCCPDLQDKEHTWPSRGALAGSLGPRLGSGPGR